MKSEIIEVFEKYEPDALLCPISMALFVCNAKLAVQKHITLREIYESSDLAFKQYKQRVFMRTHSNNWLKMHSYPKRRTLRLRDC